MLTAILRGITDHSYLSAAIIMMIIIGFRLLRAPRDRRQKSAQWRDYAQSRGWAYAPKMDELLAGLPEEYPFASQGIGRCRYVLTLAHGYSFQYEHRFSDGLKKRRDAHEGLFHVVTHRLAHPLPRLRLQPEINVPMVGRQGQEFEWAQFNEAWNVQADEPRFAHDLLTPRMMELLMTHRGAWLIVHEANVYAIVPGHQEAEDIDDLSDLLTEFVARVPTFVWERYSLRVIDR